MTLCNINQGRRSFFVSNGLSHESPLLSAVLSQAYFGSEKNQSVHTLNLLKKLFSSEEVVTKGLLADIMYMSTANKVIVECISQNNLKVYLIDFFSRSVFQDLC